LSCATVWAHPTYTGYSGALGSKGTCASSCHGSGTGSIVVTGIPNSYVPLTTYTKIVVPLSEQSTTEVDDNGTAPQQFALFQNFPNPFNPTTTINYQLSTPGRVVLKVYDPLGKEVATLVDRTETGGNKSVQFDAGTLPSGVYFYRLQAGSWVETKKLVLMR
jgi:hypothetical protein